MRPNGQGTSVKSLDLRWNEPKRNTFAYMLKDRLQQRHTSPGTAHGTLGSDESHVYVCWQIPPD